MLKGLTLVGQVMLAFFKGIFLSLVFVLNRLRIPGKARLPGFGGGTRVLSPGDSPDKAL